MIRCATIAVYCLLFFVYLAVAVWAMGCGGGGGDANQEPGSGPVSLLCEHDGDLWLCPENPMESCVRDQSSVDEGSVAESERQYLIKEVNSKPRFYLKLDSGAITIIAECGSTVNFSNSEETESNANVTTTTANFGVNTAGAE